MSLPAIGAAARAVGRFLFPTTCLACGMREVEAFFRGGVCARCWESVPHPDPNRCDLCDEALPWLEATRCGRCLLEPPPFTRLLAAAPYRGAARSILLAFKFRGADFLDRHLSSMMAERLSLAGPWDEITSVPAGPRARQAAPHAATLLGAALSRRLGIPFSSGRLVKRRDTERQSRLPLSLRAGNVRGAFRAVRPAPEHVLLVDDVATSGSTAHECAASLAAAGARHITVCCFARASRTDVGLEPPEEGMEPLEDTDLNAS
jgi:predicted amidophosphoribosyltransferase